MSGKFIYNREAVRVRVKKCEGMLQLEYRKFSVDPQITSFEVLQSILAKAFDIKGEFTVCYRVFDVYGQETYMPLLSDWELDAAFLKAHNTSLLNGAEPCLTLRVDMKPFEESSDDWEQPSTLSVFPNFKTTLAQEVRSSPRFPGLMNKVEKTFSMVQKAFNLGEEVSALELPPRPPVSDSEFRKYQDSVGQIINSQELRNVIYYGGIDPSLRKVVWKHILNVYPEGMSGRERMDYMKRKAAEYIELRNAWKEVVQKGPVTGDLAYTTGMVRKDVLRTDRHHKFYAGNDDNQNIASLFNILTTYALNHPRVSYCQGMSDLASPLLVTMGDEAHAYICFCALMSRLYTNFMLDGIAMTQKFTHLAEGLLYYDPEFYNYLKLHQADDLLFCYRWLLLEMKREFAFDDSLRMLEILWSSLPATPPEKELPLYETQFRAPITPLPMSPLIKTPRENAYTKVCALRRQSSSVSLASHTLTKIKPVRRQIHSLDENFGRHINLQDIKFRSLDDAAMPSPKSKTGESNGEDTRSSSVSPLEPKSDSVILNNKMNASQSNTFLSMGNLLTKQSNKKTGHFKNLKERIGTKGVFSSVDRVDKIKEEQEGSTKIVKNLNEFFHLASKKNVNENPTITLTTSCETTEKIQTNDSAGAESEARDSTADENSSPDDSQEYFPMTTSVTREAKLDFENLDRQIFGPKYNHSVIDDSDSSSSESSLENKTRCDCIVSKSDVGDTSDTTTEVAEIGSTPKPNSLKIDCPKSKTDDIFIWENPLHQPSPSLNLLHYPPTPDEQAELEYDEETGIIIDESNKSIAPIRFVQKNQKKQPDKNETKTEEKKQEHSVNGDIPVVTHLCEEVTEVKSGTFSLPPPSEFGGGNPFLMFLCITVLLQHRDTIIRNCMDYNEMAMHFDKMIRKHNVIRVLNQARQMYAVYMKKHTKPTDLRGDCA